MPSRACLSRGLPRDDLRGVAQATGAAQCEHDAGGWNHGTARAGGRSAGRGRSPPGRGGEGRAGFERPRTSAGKEACGCAHRRGRRRTSRCSFTDAPARLAAVGDELVRAQGRSVGRAGGEKLTLTLVWCFRWSGRRTCTRERRGALASEDWPDVPMSSLHARAGMIRLQRSGPRATATGERGASAALARPSAEVPAALPRRRAALPAAPAALPAALLLRPRQSAALPPAERGASPAGAAPKPRRAMSKFLESPAAARCVDHVLRPLRDIGSGTARSGSKRSGQICSTRRRTAGLQRWSYSRFEGRAGLWRRLAGLWRRSAGLARRSPLGRRLERRAASMGRCISMCIVAKTHPQTCTYVP